MKKFIIAGLAMMPMLASAQELSNVSTLLNSIGRLINAALPIVLGLALLGFFWGLALFIFNANNEEKQKEGKSIMIYGVVALFVMVAVWGLVRFIGTALNIDTTGGTVNVPGVTGLK